MARNTAPYFQNFTGPETFLVTSLERGGELGNTVERGSNKWQLVTVTTTCAAKDVLYWKSKANFTVTATIGESSSNEVAGVAEVAVTVANSAFYIKQRGLKNTKAGAGTFARGTRAVSDTSANRVIPLAATTQASIGIAQSATSGGFVDIVLELDAA